MITVHCNGQPHTIAEHTSLIDAMNQWGYNTQKEFAVAINEMFVSRTQHSDTLLANGDHLDIVTPIQGG